MADDVILDVLELGFPWQTWDPFLFCVHHYDAYPEGNEQMGPAASLAGRSIGADFGGKDGWSMYHGQVVPGFPRHPHRGFETVTIARQGFIDHADSLGATARFGRGDVQWMTAGAGVVHSEAFPLLRRDEPNTTELFQIWLNLPRADKLVDPYFTMLWDETIPRVKSEGVEVTVVAGRYGDATPPAPPPNSWAAREQSNVAIWAAKLEAGASLTLPAGPSDTNRAIYFFEGSRLRVADREFPLGRAIRVRPDRDVEVQTIGAPGEILVLQGTPIGEPVVQHGPFVMNTVGEIRQAMVDYQQTQFGGWPWPAESPVHPREKGRFAIHADGRVEER